MKPRRRLIGQTAAGIIALLWLIAPLTPILLWALTERWSFPDSTPQAWGLQGWRDALAADLGPALLRSFALGLAVSLIATPLGLLIGRGLGWRLTRRPPLVVAALLLPLILPPFAVSMGMDVLVIRLGIPEEISVVALLATIALPYASYTTAAGFARTPPSLADQARALGATSRQAHLRVIVPALRGPVLVAALLSFLVGWSDYVVTLLIGGGQLITAPLLLGSAASGSGNNAMVAAMAIATLAPPVVLVLIAGARRTGGVR